MQSRKQLSEGILREIQLSMYIIQVNEEWKTDWEVQWYTMEKSKET